MPANLIDGRALAAAIRERVSREAADLRAAGRPATLAAVLFGGDGGAEAYAQSQARAAAEWGIDHRVLRLDVGVSASDAADAIQRLSDDPTVSGILLLQPVPSRLDVFELQQRIAAGKDVEGVSAENIGRLVMGRRALVPCTAAAAFECVRATGVDLVGRHAVVVGRSAIVGKPVAALLLAAHATVTHCHSRTADLASVCRQADVLVVAVGSPGLIGRGHVRPGAAVVDVGTNRVPSASGGSRLVGDVRFDEVRDVAGWLTPVPGGVGPVTVAMLLANVTAAARSASRG